MGVIMHKGVAYGGGSNVEANPAGSSTDDISKLGIDGTIYDIVDADAVHSTDIGVASGVASLDSNGKVPSGQLPTYPTVNNSTITIQKNGTTVDTFTTNQSSAKTINITMAKADVGLGNVPNVATDDQTPTVTEATTRANLASGDTLKTIVGKIKKFFSDLKTVAFTGSYSDLTDKPTIPSAQVQSDWNQTTTTAVDYIKNKPTSMPASDVSAWAKAANKPTYTASEVGAIPLNGSENITGDLMPKNDDSITLGATNKRYQDVWSKNIFASEILRVGASGELGELSVVSYEGYYGSMRPATLTANRALYMPNKTGVIATTDDIPTVQDNASATDLTDTSVPTGRTIESYLNSKMTWNLLYNSYIFPSSTAQSFTPTVSFSNVHEVLVSLVYNTNSYRQSFVFVYDIVRRSGMVFPDFYFAGSRLYCSILLNTSTGKIEVGSGGGTGSTSWGNKSGGCSIALFYR